MIRQNYNLSTLSDKQVNDRVNEMMTMWETADDTKYLQTNKLIQARQETLSEYFGMLEFNPGAPRKHSLHSDAELLLELAGIWHSDTKWTAEV